MKLLGADVGGTTTSLALLSRYQQQWKIEKSATYSSANYPGLLEIVQHYIAKLDEPPARAGFGVAGPVQDRKCITTNLPWHVDAEQMEQVLGFEQISLLNDLEAVAWGIDCLTSEELITLQPGSGGSVGNRAVIAPGTGLGEAGLYWDGRQHHPFATEGGHCDFAPENDLEFALKGHLQQTLDRATWEDLLSGPGLINIYHFLLQRHQQPIPDWLQSEEDPAAAISQQADTQSDSIAHQAMELFVQLLGRETGNLALKLMATGGIYIGGGIAPKILHRLQQPLFLEHFHQKGKMQQIMDAIPIAVILNHNVSLLGAANYLRHSS